MKKISKQELQQIIKEEIEKENLIEIVLPSMSDWFGNTGESVGTSTSEKLIGWLVGLILEAFGINPKSPLSLIVRKSIGNIDTGEWAVIISGAGGSRCGVVADNVYEGIVEGGGVAIVKALVGDTGTDSETSLLGSSLLGVGEEMITNWLKSTEVATEIKTSLSKIICQGIEEFNIVDIFFGEKENTPIK